MEIILVLIGFSITMALGFLLAFSWAVKNGQYDDTYTPGMRMLFSDSTKSTKNTTNTNQQEKDRE
ncbi:cbb3-type cytochrome oxidase assembly protein CcoS [bacterium]|nr:MAG: cbb3-type cytochrome oxidase assembly protein CcoS [bacterium]